MMHSRFVGALFATLSSLALLGCPAPAPPRDVASAERCDDLPNIPELGAIYSSPVSRVDPLMTDDGARGAGPTKLAGAAIRLRDLRVDDALLARALACHAGRAEVEPLSAVAPRIDPLRPPGGAVRVEVERQNEDVIVRVTSRDEAIAGDVYRRAVILGERAQGLSRRVASDRR